jgi:signal transduction histidine kinase
MSHELRTPLNAVIGYADLLEANVPGPLTADQKLDIQRIKASSRHLSSLVNEVLDLAKIEAGGMAVERDPIRVADTIREALDMILPSARARSIELAAEFECDRDATYLGDSDRARQVLVNLLSNAVKFSPAGGRIAVTCRLHDGAAPATLGDGSWVRVDVEDSGVGIAAEHLERIFEPFVQVDDARTRAAGGTGLGLTISRRLTRMMEGDLTVESRPGSGSCFTLWLRSGA